MPSASSSQPTESRAHTPLLPLPTSLCPDACAFSPSPPLLSSSSSCESWLNQSIGQSVNQPPPLSQPRAHHLSVTLVTTIVLIPDPLSAPPPSRHSSLHPHLFLDCSRPSSASPPGCQSQPSETQFTATTTNTITTPKRTLSVHSIIVTAHPRSRIAQSSLSQTESHSGTVHHLSAWIYPISP